MHFRHTFLQRIIFKSGVFAFGVLRKPELWFPCCMAFTFFCFWPSAGMDISTCLTPPERECHKIMFSEHVQLILSLLYFSLFVGPVVFLTCFGNALPTEHGDNTFWLYFFFQIVPIKYHPKDSPSDLHSPIMSKYLMSVMTLMGL